MAGKFMGMKIIGITNMFHFTPKDSATPISGKTFYYTESIRDGRGKGESCGKFFMTEEKINRLNVKPVVGDYIELAYNRYKTIVSLHILDSQDEDMLDFGD